MPYTHTQAAMKQAKDITLIIMVSIPIPVNCVGRLKSQMFLILYIMWKMLLNIPKPPITMMTIGIMGWRGQSFIRMAPIIIIARGTVRVKNSIIVHMQCPNRSSRTPLDKSTYPEDSCFNWMNLRRMESFDLPSSSGGALSVVPYPWGWVEWVGGLSVSHTRSWVLVEVMLQINGFYIWHGLHSCVRNKQAFKLEYRITKLILKY